MTIARLRQPRGAAAQLYPLLEKVGIKIGTYTRKIDATTDELVRQGYVIKPDHNKVNYPYAMNSTLETILSMNDSQHLILPDNSPLLLNKPTEKASKLQLARIPHYNAMSSEERNKPLIAHVANILQMVHIGNRYAGYDWYPEHMQDTRMRIVHLVDIIRANIIAKDPAIKAVVYDYSIGKKPDQKYREGANALVANIPSIRMPELTYNILLLRVPQFSGSSANPKNILPEEARQTFNLDAYHVCGKEIPYYLAYSRGYGDDNMRKIAPELLCDHHVVLAYLKYSEYINSGNEGWYIPQTFPLAGEGLSQVFWKLYSSCLREQITDGNIERQPLKLMEIERILWNYIGYINDERKNPKEYIL
jgi:hypothetical protein